VLKLGPELICLLLRKKSIRKYIVELRVEGDYIVLKVRVPQGYEDIKKCIEKYSTRRGVSGA